MPNVKKMLSWLDPKGRIRLSFGWHFSRTPPGILMADIRSKLNYISERKRRQETLLEDIRAGKYDGIVENASAYFAKKSPEKPRDKVLVEALPGAQAHEGDRGRTVIRSYAIEPGGRGQPYGLADDADAPPPTEALHFLSPDLSEGEPIEADSICFLDTETTGLSGGTGTLAFLVGVGWWERGATGRWCFRLEQYLIEDFCHECDMMERLAQRIEQFSIICTYNGKVFDLPLLRTRATLQRIPPKTFRKKQLDLLHFSRRIWGRVLPSVSLKNVEKEILGFDRGPDLDGAMIPSIFFHMARTGQTDRMAAVLDHNAWDIITLSSLLRRLAAIAQNPLGCGLLTRHGEFAAVARWYESRRQFDDAALAWSRALERCRVEADERELMDRLARVLKRQKRWPEALAIWEQRRGGRLRDSLPAWIELAKYHEHVARNAADALALVRECRRSLEIETDLAAITSGTEGRALLESTLADMEKRETRLRRRLERARKGGKARKTARKSRSPAA